MGSFKTYFTNSLSGNLSESQMMDRVKKLKPKQKIEFDLKNLKEDKLENFKRKLSEAHFLTIVENDKIIIQKP